jgi:nitroimidazol reductase NimA-like FMN-containing flavoprotein (pyridoxamine 5'-phosphate oxidase superfamily)
MGSGVFRKIGLGFRALREYPRLLHFSSTSLLAIRRSFPMPDPYPPTSRTRVIREPERAVYDHAVAYQILDEGFFCHVGFVAEGQPFVIPTSYGRKDNNLYIHGSASSRMLRTLDQGVPVCVTVTLLDGLVLARSIFNHSMNYRSVVVLGTAVAVTDPREKLAALRALSQHILPGRWDEVRQPNEKELKATLVMRLPIEEFSAKVRQGPPVDDTEDYSFPTWAGVIPLELVASEPISDPKLEPKREAPKYARSFARKRR